LKQCVPLLAYFLDNLINDQRNSIEKKSRVVCVMPGKAVCVAGAATEARNQGSEAWLCSHTFSVGLNPETSMVLI